MCSATRGRRVGRLQPDMRAPVRVAIRHGAQPSVQLRDAERAVERGARDPPARRVRCKRQPLKDPGPFLANL